MMPYKPIEVERMLLTKLKMVDEENDHTWFKFEIDGLPPIRTKISHNKKDIRDGLESRIFKQLRVRKTFFHELMDCTKNRNEYIQQVQEDPYPPFSVPFV